IQLVQRALVREGWEVRSATSVDQLASVSAGFAPDIVLVDMNIPGTTNKVSVATAREIAPDARLVIYSSWDEARLRVACAELGADAYLSKSTSMLEIGARLSAISATR